MRVLKTAIAMIVIGTALSAGSAVAQTPPPATQKPTPPITPPPGVQKPAEPAKPQPPAPFPEGAKIAIVNVQFVVSATDEGKKAIAQVSEMANKKSGELADRQKKIESETKKFEEAQRVGMNEQARSQKQRELEQMARDFEYAEQDAQKEMQTLQQKVIGEFIQTKIDPIVAAIVKEKGLHMVLRPEPAVIAWADPGLDISDEIVARINKSAPAPPKK
jgi:Skp family chaperone for outer membrane proteins